MKTTNNSALDNACNQFSVALARAEFCYNDALRKQDRASARYYANKLKWQSIEDSQNKGAKK